MMSTRCLFAAFALSSIAGFLDAADMPAPKPPKAPDAATWKPSVFPDRVVLCMSDDPAHRMAVTWRTSKEVSTPFAQIAVAEAGSKFSAKARRVEARTQPLRTDLGDALYHEAVLDQLQPNTLYVYRVGDGTHFSEWLQFRTASEGRAPFAFIYFGDAQNDLKQHWSRVIRQAQSDAPKARFFLHAGDLVNRGASDAEWGEWCHAGGFLHAQIACVASPGNHEYSRGPTPRLKDLVAQPLDVIGQVTKKPAITAHWRRMFAFPENGPLGLEETVYYFDYQGVRFVSLNSNVEQEAQVKWLDEVLAHNPNRWTIVTFHHPIFSTARGRDNKKLRHSWQPTFDRHHIDLVLQGHDHSYGRSGLLETNLVAGLQVHAGRTGTVYVVSVSGPKAYSVEDHEWMVEHGTGRQLYQVISIDGDTLHYESRTATGELYDVFELRKQSDGRNHLLEKADLEAEGKRFGGLTPVQTYVLVGAMLLGVVSLTALKAWRRGARIA